MRRRNSLSLPCIRITYRPTTLLLLVIAPLELEGDAKPVLSKILVDCERSSTTIVSSGDAERASGQMNACKIVKSLSNMYFM